MAVIDAHRVLVNGSLADKPARLVDPADAVVVEGDGPRFVSRGGEKLAGALDAFSLDVTGLRALDAGASTGGFTDCLLQAGVAHVLAVDVGHGQLHARLRSHPQVTVMERCNVRHLTPQQIGGPVDLVVADLSFISLTAVVPALVAACRPGAPLVLLVKPQFEVGRRDASRGKGVITDPALHRAACERVSAALAACGAETRGLIVSPLKGADGNVEFLLLARAPDGLGDGSDSGGGEVPS